MSKPFSNGDFPPPNDNNNQGSGGSRNGNRQDGSSDENGNSASQRAAQHARCMDRVRTVIEDVMTILVRDQEMRRSMEGEEDGEEDQQQRNRAAPSSAGAKSNRWRNPRNPRERDQ
eukprot:CAMPEP_0176032854 /NCGR_PEP_ID=MMETSP0120_2-20121206/16221_1 /TAXON_ID=160619 /ORGANISM="Kryptoperidinium foliaceum, Strain CCMP 1326" /LENGTH=115 /DNA_ID=CAMNT_0017366175 /DNA_START=45 /DNA_END=392 /DNA_ORIENTATION=+